VCTPIVAKLVSEINGQNLWTHSAYGAEQFRPYVIVARNQYHVGWQLVLGAVRSGQFGLSRLCRAAKIPLMYT